MMQNSSGTRDVFGKDKGEEEKNISPDHFVVRFNWAQTFII